MAKNPKWAVWSVKVTEVDKEKVPVKRSTSPKAKRKGVKEGKDSGVRRK